MKSGVGCVENKSVSVEKAQEIDLMEPTVMAYIAGVDVGNNTTEVAIAEVNQQGRVSFLSSAIVRTVGIKGTIQNAMGVIFALDTAL
ncbi:MAG: hypothetical protein AABY92_08525, partial [Thermodesulfobacteriota bacterium]